ncbi:MAG TPA: hypothetical protein PKC43_06145 [Phycisphaerales bacterium]|nr:hypothetical protein [Phycisphaerales bacterium]HMP37013.1 hypothetical protein [Phycisphaerales bacterium]
MQPQSPGDLPVPTVPPPDQRRAIRDWIDRELDAGRIRGEKPEDVAIRATDELGYHVAPLSVHAAYMVVCVARRIRGAG